MMMIYNDVDGEVDDDVDDDADDGQVQLDLSRFPPSCLQSSGQSSNAAPKAPSLVV